MPKWIQVLTYVVILFLFVYLTILPNYIDGKLIAKLDEAVGYFPIEPIFEAAYFNQKSIVVDMIDRNHGFTLKERRIIYVSANNY